MGQNLEKCMAISYGYVEGGNHFTVDSWGGQRGGHAVASRLQCNPSLHLCPPLRKWPFSSHAEDESVLHRSPWFCSCLY